MKTQHQDYLKYIEHLKTLTYEPHVKYVAITVDNRVISFTRNPSSSGNSCGWFPNGSSYIGDRIPSNITMNYKKSLLSLNVLFKDKCNKLTCDTVGEVIDALMNGYTIYFDNTAYKWNNGIEYYSHNGNWYEMYANGFLEDLKNEKNLSTSVVASIGHWYDDIPSTGIECYIGGNLTNVELKEENIISTIYGFNGDIFDGLHVKAATAIPVIYFDDPPIFAKMPLCKGSTKSWYDKIPKGGITCYVESLPNATDKITKDITTTIYKFDGNLFYGKTKKWSHAIPVEF